jgi:hypothetical protein
VKEKERGRRRCLLFVSLPCADACDFVEDLLDEVRDLVEFLRKGLEERSVVRYLDLRKGCR